MRRGDVVLIADRAGGDYGGKPRPAVVVQSDLFDATNSLVICPLTTEGHDAPLLRVAVRPSPTLRLAVPSWVMVEKITSVRRERARDTGPTVGAGDDGTGSKLGGASCLRLSYAGASGDNRRREIS